MQEESMALDVVQETTSEFEVKQAQTQVMLDVKKELNRQLEKWGIQNNNPVEWVSIETEELGEASAEANKAYWTLQDRPSIKEAIEHHTPLLEMVNLLNNWKDRSNRHLDLMREEFVQVAAVAVAAIESMDRQRRQGLL